MSIEIGTKVINCNEKIPNLLKTLLLQLKYTRDSLFMF